MPPGSEAPISFPFAGVPGGVWDAHPSGSSHAWLTFCGHHRLRPADSERRERIWSLLRGLLETYIRLREEDQSFAVEVMYLGTC